MNGAPVWLARGCAALALVMLGGCATLFPQAEVADTTPVEPRAPAYLPTAATGSIYQAASYRPLFEDHRARHVGDTLLIRIEERISATQTAKSQIDKSGSVEAIISALPGVSSKALTRAGASGSSSNSFEGKGTTESSNNFTGSITATVTRVLANGHLIISGEKQLGVNQNVDVLRFSGQVDPRTIRPGNVVSSMQVANVRVDQRARGAQAEAQRIGWLARVFLSVLPM
ncbi:MAG: flagellar basal body L-ring protein FlgH [Rubrivivax sp.]